MGSEAEGTAGVEATEEAGGGAASQEVVIVEAGVGSEEEGETAEAGEVSQPGTETLLRPSFLRGCPYITLYGIKWGVSQFIAFFRGVCQDYYNIARG